MRKFNKWEKDNTRMKDCNGKEIMGGDPIVWWDSDFEIHDFGIIDKINGEWEIINPYEQRKLGFKSTTLLRVFSPKNVRVLK